VAGFHHEAVFYRDDDEYLAGTLPDIRRTVADDGAVLVAVPRAKRALIEQALGADGDHVAFADMAELGRNPACIIPAWRAFVEDAAPRPVVGVGEPVWPGRSDAELDECSRHESLLNLAFDGGRPWRLLCPYDTASLEDGVIAEACRNHPYVGRDGDHWASDDYAGRRAVLARDDTLARPGQRTAEVAFGGGDLVLVRAFVTASGRRAGLHGGRLHDLVLAVSELVANTIRHAGGSGVLRTWNDGATLYCEVADGGWIQDPLAGRSRPADVRNAGRGLWIVNHVCDLVQIRASKAGTVIRLHMSLA
jgi:anti-sigma regulatory factor (Ser/Thr protein kinase)